LISDDGGQKWTVVALPTGVAGSSLAAVSVAPGGQAFLAVAEGDAVRVYHKTGSTAEWASTLLVPTWPKIAGQQGPGDNVFITPGPGDLVTSVVSLRIGTSLGFSSLFVSTDGGATFTEHGAPEDSEVNTLWWSATFVTPKSGVVVGGPAQTDLFHTRDAGASWSPVSIGGLPSVYEFGRPVVIGSDLELPVTSQASDGSELFTVLKSRDGGATFGDLKGGALSVSTDYSGPAISDSLGAVTWVVPRGGGKIYVSSDAGKTWMTVTASGLTRDVVSIGLTTPTTAVAVMANGTCTGFKVGCSQYHYLVGTTDGGQSWTSLDPTKP
jgi:photosystem II stability/assembly factor-like uncharacterized protein